MGFHSVEWITDVDGLYLQHDFWSHENVPLVVDISSIDLAFSWSSWDGLGLCL